MRRKDLAAIGISMALCLSLLGCGKSASVGNNANSTNSKTNVVKNVTAISLVDTTDMFSDKDKEGTYDKSSATEIKLSGTSATASGSGVSTSKGLVTITKEGTYILSGSFEGQIVVNVADEKAKVQLVLDNVTLKNSGSAAIYALDADKVFITCVGESSISVTGEYVNSADTNIDAAVFGKTDITFNGTGTFNITSEYDNAIVSKDDLKICGGTYVIKAANDGIQGKDSVRISDGNITIVAGGDAIQAKNDDDATKGYVYIEGGNFDITTGGGSKNASTKTDNMGGFGRNFGQNTTSSTSDDSNKAIKASLDIIINGGTFTIDSKDDAIHSNSNVAINEGTFAINSGDDGIHADNSVLITDGTIDIAKSYEGIEGLNITVDGGKIDIVASDDGFNAAGGNDMSSMNGRAGQNTFASGSSSSVYLTINGGDITVNSDGDGLDANGALYVNGGNIVVYGQASGGNGALDYDQTAQITGGTLIAFGYSQMAQNFTSSSTQGSILYNLDTYYKAGTSVTLKDSKGNVIASATSLKQFNSVVISDSKVKSGETYTLTVGTTDYTINMTSLIYGAGEEGMGGMPGDMNGNMNGGRGNMQGDMNGNWNGNMKGGRGNFNGEMPQDFNGEMPQNFDKGAGTENVM